MQSMGGAESPEAEGASHELGGGFSGDMDFGAAAGLPAAWHIRRFLEEENCVSLYGVVIGLLLAFPWALVGVVSLGAAISSVGRWLSRPSRPSLIAGRGLEAQSRFTEGGQQQATGGVAAGLSKVSPQSLPVRKAA